MGGTVMGMSPTRQVNGCLAETLILALEGRGESFSIGRELPLRRSSDRQHRRGVTGFLPHLLPLRRAD